MALVAAPSFWLVVLSVLLTVWPWLLLRCVPISCERPSSHAVVVQAIDPFAGYGDSLRATCAALPAVTTGHDNAVVRERAADALAHACITPG